MGRGIDDEVRHLLKRRPRVTTQDASGGPYSPVMQVDARHLPVRTVVQSGFPVVIEMWAVAAEGS